MVLKSKRKPGGTVAAVKLAELGFAAPQVIAHRLTRMVLAGPSISTRDREEFTGMVVEKHAAVSQACMGIFLEGVRFQQQFALCLLMGATPRLHAAQAKSASSRIANAGLAPFHRKAVANAKRLARTKLR